MAASAARIAAVREFNRFYTRRIGVLHEGLLESPYSLAEVRVLYELAHRSGATARDLARDLGLDAGLPEPHPAAASLRRGLVRRGTAADDARQRPLSLTPSGRRAFAPLDRRSREGSRGDARAAGRDRAGAPDRRHGGDRAHPRSESRACRRSCCARIARATWAGSCRRTASSTGASTAGTSASRRSSRTSPAEFIDKFDANARALLDRRARRRARGIGLPRAKVGDRGEAAAADRRPEGARRGLGRHARRRSASASRANAAIARITLWTQQNLVAARRIYEAGRLRARSSARTTRCSACRWSARRGSSTLRDSVRATAISRNVSSTLVADQRPPRVHCELAARRDRRPLASRGAGHRGCRRADRTRSAARRATPAASRRAA